MLLELFFQGIPVLEIFKLGGQCFYFSLKQLVENRNRQAMKAEAYLWLLFRQEITAQPENAATVDKDRTVDEKVSQSMCQF